MENKIIEIISTITKINKAELVEKVDTEKLLQSQHELLIPIAFQYQLFLLVQLY